MATLQLTINNTSFTEFAKVMKSHTDFKTYGNLSGHHNPLKGCAYTGMLPRHHKHFENWQDSLANATYIVFSYATPIAWFDSARGYWIMPDVKYSMTTSKSQGRIAPAVSILNREINEQAYQQCVLLQRLDTEYKTPTNSPLHHSNRCIIPGHMTR